MPIWKFWGVFLAICENFMLNYYSLRCEFERTVRFPFETCNTSSLNFMKMQTEKQCFTLFATETQRISKVALDPMSGGMLS